MSVEQFKRELAGIVTAAAMLVDPSETAERGLRLVQAYRLALESSSGVAPSTDSADNE